MFMRMKKVLLALGLVAAAGSSSAFYVPSGGGLTLDGYCAVLSDRNVMKVSMAACQQSVDAATATGSQIIKPCHMCAQKFKTVPETAIKLTPEVVHEYVERSEALRAEFRIDEYERAQQELQRTFWPEAD